MALSLAHALELPGKYRLDRDAYLAIQSVYYPGFTVGGVSEPLAILAALALLLATPSDDPPFWLTFVALLALIAMRLIFWLVTQRVNKFWFVGQNATALSLQFFGAASWIPDNWTVLRDRWEYSHLARAILAVTAFVLLLVAIKI